MELDGIKLDGTGWEIKYLFKSSTGYTGRTPFKIP
jgi:hypothetical protein